MLKFDKKQSIFIGIF